MARTVPPSNETRWQRANRLGRASFEVIGEDRRLLFVAIGGALLLAAQALTISLNQIYRVFLYRSTLASATTALGPFSRADLDHPFRSRKRRL